MTVLRRFIPLLVVVLGAGCARHEDRAAFNPAGNTLADDGWRVDAKTWQSTIKKKKDRIYIDVGDIVLLPNVPMYELSSELKKNPKINYFIVIWGWAIDSSGGACVATYDRRTQKLRYKWQGGDGGKSINHHYLFTGVTEKKIQQAVQRFSNGPVNSPFENLSKCGCKRINSRE